MCEEICPSRVSAPLTDEHIATHGTTHSVDVRQRSAGHLNRTAIHPHPRTSPSVYLAGIEGLLRGTIGSWCELCITSVDHQA